MPARTQSSHRLLFTECLRDQRFAGHSEKVPIAPVRSIAETLDDPILAANNMVIQMAHPTFGTLRETGCPIKISTGKIEHRPGPVLGHDTEEILTCYLGILPEEIANLRGNGIV